MRLLRVLLCVLMLAAIAAAQSSSTSGSATDQNTAQQPAQAPQSPLAEQPTSQQTQQQAETQAGKGSLPYDHPLCLGAIGSTGTSAANEIARDADVVIGVGTRYSDFTTSSSTGFQASGVRFVNLNVAAFDAGKHAGEALVADARAGLDALTRELAGYRVSPAYGERVRELTARWQQVADRAYHLGHQPRPAHDRSCPGGRPPSRSGSARSRAGRRPR